MNENEKRIQIISANIKKYLQENKMTQSKLAKDVGVSKSTMSDYLNLRSAPSYGVIQKIAEAFKVNKSDIDSTFKDNRENAEKINQFSLPYNFYDVGLSAGCLQTVDPFTSTDVETINMPNALMGKYAGDRDIFISRVNGESMNHTLPDGSLIAIKKYDTLNELKDGDIVVFQDGGDMSIKRFYNNVKGKIISFAPDSSDNNFQPITYRYEDIQQINILGRVVIYTVEL